MTLFSYSISHNFPALKLWNEKSEAIVKINRVPKKASIWEIKGDIFVSSEIRQMKGNLHTVEYKCKWNEMDMYRRGCKHNVSSKFFPFSVNSRERIQLSQK